MSDPKSIADFVSESLGEKVAQLRLQREEGYFSVGRPQTGHSVEKLLRKFGLWKWTNKNAFKLDYRKNRILIKSLPDALNGLRILHLSDFHFGFDPRGLNPALEKLKTLSYDLAVFTGDVVDRNANHANGWKEWDQIREMIQGPLYAVPGNHDSMYSLKRLHDDSVECLLNENRCIDWKGSSFYLSGVDDMHHFKTHDIKKAFSGIPENAFHINLSHVPNLAKEVEGKAQLMLSGHTHGGQVCLPGGIPLYRNGTCVMNQSAGNWKYKSLQGYTSRGIGSSGVCARAFCHPEVVIHVLVNS